MVNSCAIKGCRSRSVKGGVLRFFSFPKKEPMAKAWLRYCKHKISTKTGRVCSMHFVPSDFRIPLRYVIMKERPPSKIRSLKPDAVPSQYVIECSEPESEEEEETSVEPDLDTCITDCTNEHENGCCTEPTLDTSSDIDIETTDVVCSTKCTEKEDVPETTSSVQKVESDSITIPASEYKSLTAAKAKLEDLTTNLESIFTPGQIRYLSKTDNGNRRVCWSAEDISAAVAFRNVSRKAYRYVREVIGIPLPGPSTLAKWVAKYEIKDNADFSCDVEVVEEDASDKMVS